MRPLIPVATLLLSCLPLPATTHAADVRYTLNQVGNATWEYHYTVTHDGDPAGAPLWEFAIGFDPTLYREPSLGIATPASLSTKWDERILASSLVLDAFYDAQATIGGLAAGESSSGFRVRFEWTGPGAPGDQPFWIFAPGNPAPLQQGRTAAEPIDPVPVAGPWLNWALLFGLLFVAAFRLKTQRRQTGRR